jgi:hypothetical protein
MTHCREDFNGTLTPYASVVETANGGMVRVTHRGSVDIFLSDAFRPDNSMVVKLNNVLYVPGLTKRLISVHEWNSSGQIYHMTDRTRTEIYDEDGKVLAMIDLPPCPGPNFRDSHSERAERGKSTLRTTHQDSPITRSPTSRTSIHVSDTHGNGSGTVE